MGMLQSDSVTPLYQQLYEILREQIRQGLYRPGERIPSEAKLSEQYQISRVTVRGTLAKLVEENILIKVHGKGTFVSSPVFVESANARGSFIKSCLLMNAVPSTKLVSRGIQKADRVLAAALEMEEGELVIWIKRLRLTNGQPAIFEIDYFSEEYRFMLEADVEHKPLLEVIAQQSTHIGCGYLDTFEVKYAGKEQAKWLECPLYSALLGVSQIVYRENRRVLYYNIQYIRSDVYKYVMRA